jgi:hypothetical protein
MTTTARGTAKNPGLARRVYDWMCEHPGEAIEPRHIDKELGLVPADGVGHSSPASNALAYMVSGKAGPTLADGTRYAAYRGVTRVAKGVYRYDPEPLNGNGNGITDTIFGDGADIPLPGFTPAPAPDDNLMLVTVIHTYPDGRRIVTDDNGNAYRMEAL